MLIFMRTTVVLDDQLFHQARKRAAEQGQTLSDIINDALREALTHPQPTKPTTPFRMVTFGGLGKESHEPADFENASLEEDLASLGRTSC